MLITFDRFVRDEYSASDSIPSSHPQVHVNSGAQSIAAVGPLSLPVDTAQHVAFVGGLDRIDPPRGFTAEGYQSHDGVLDVSDPAYVITPAVIRDLYSLPPDTVPSAGALQGIAAFNNESFLPSDLATFQIANGLKPQPVAKTIGPAVLERGTAEGDLDVQYIMGVS